MKVFTGNNSTKKPETLNLSSRNSTLSRLISRVCRYNRTSNEPLTVPTLRSPSESKALLEPRQIQPTTPRLTKNVLKPQSLMVEPISLEHLSTTDIVGIFKWHHPSFDSSPELILNTAQYYPTEEQPKAGDSSGSKIENNITKENFYFKLINTPSHAWAQKGTEQLYNLFYENTGITPTPENFLCFDMDRLEDGIVGIASRINPNITTLFDYTETLLERQKTLEITAFNRDTHLSHEEASNRPADEIDLIAHQLNDDLENINTWNNQIENFLVAAHEMLEGLEIVHRILGNHDVHQTNVMLEINPDNLEPIRPQVLDLGDTFTHWEKGEPVLRARQPELNASLFGPWVHLKDRLHTPSEISILENFLTYDISIVNPKIESIVNRYFSGSEQTRQIITKTIQARINSAFKKSGLQENSDELIGLRKPNRYNDSIIHNNFRTLNSMQSIRDYIRPKP
ncbi:MAG: hypothetical protein V4629_05820 [Pseudomonadota bacterium]